jgi:hypothetical protein
MPKMKSIVVLLLLGAVSACAEIRLGIIGTDNSQVTAFTKILNDASSPDYLPGARVVAAYKGGSPDVESSSTRVDKFAEELRTKWKIEFASDIPALCRKVDGVLLESVDGRAHLEQAKAVIAAHKPLFIDKPLAATLEDAREIARLAKEANVPWFSASSLRFAEIALALKFPDITGALAWGPGPLEPHHHLDLSWYAIHEVELLYTLMGRGCDEVTRVSTPDADVVVGKWKDGRLGTVRALRPYGKFGAVVFRSEEKVNQSDPKSTDSYRPLLVEIVKFFETKQPPFPNEDTLEMFAFMDAAQRSKEAGGAPMKLR